MRIIRRMGKVMLGVLGLLVTTGGVLYALAPHPPATPKEGKDLAQLEAHLVQLVAAGGPPGLSITVVKNGELVYNRAFGMADAPKGQRATAATVYHWWSMTKIITAMAILQLQERGQLELDDPVNRHLPWFAVDDPAATNQPITLRQLLNHSSGLPDTVPSMIGWVHYDDAGRSQSELAQRYLPRFNKLRFAPGSKAIYSNLNYMVLGAVIEAVSGRSYETFITENILQPLRMERSGFVYTPAMARDEAAGTLPVVHFYTPLLPFLLDARQLIRQQEGGFFWLRRLYIDVTPPTGLIGPASDGARLMMAYLNGGELDGVRILSAQSVALMTNADHTAGEGPNMAAYRGGRHGLGWYVIPEGQAQRLQHHGAGPGFATTMRLYPAQGLGIMILANGTDLDRDGIADRLAQIDWRTHP